MTEPNVYTHVHLVMRDEEKKSVLLRNALRELIAFKKKYAVLNELNGLFSEIEKAEAQMQKAGARLRHEAR